MIKLANPYLEKQLRNFTVLKKSVEDTRIFPIKKVYVNTMKNKPHLFLVMEIYLGS